MRYNFCSCLLMLGGMVTSFHYHTKKSGSCPIMIAEGESQTGKSTTIRVALSLIGSLAESKAECMHKVTHEQRRKDQCTSFWTH